MEDPSSQVNQKYPKSLQGFGMKDFATFHHASTRYFDQRAIFTYLDLNLVRPRLGLEILEI